jgi:hypothetical protein
MIARFASALLLTLTLALPAAANDVREQTLLGGKASFSLPAGIDVMPDEMKKLKYSGANAPQEVFGNERGTVSVAVAVSPYPGNHTLKALTPAMAAGINKAGNVADWHKIGLRTIDGREFGVLEFNSKAIDTEIYNHIYITKRGDELVVFTVNCSAGLLDEWRSKFEAIVESTRVSEP